MNKALVLIIAVLIIAGVSYFAFFKDDNKGETRNDNGGSGTGNNNAPPDQNNGNIPGPIHIDPTVIQPPPPAPISILGKQAVVKLKSNVKVYDIEEFPKVMFTKTEKGEQLGTVVGDGRVTIMKDWLFTSIPKVIKKENFYAIQTGAGKGWVAKSLVELK